MVHHFDDQPDGVHKRGIEQGYEMGRPSLIYLTLVVEGGRLGSVRIGGHAVRVAEGRLDGGAGAGGAAPRGAHTKGSCNSSTALA